MSLSGSELARITREGDDIVLAFAVAQLRPEAAPRFGQGDDTAYLAGVTWRLTAAVVDASVETEAQASDGLACASLTGTLIAPLIGRLMGRLSDSELWVDGEARARSVLALPGTVPGPLTLHLRTSLSQALTLRAQRLEAVLPQAGEAPRPSLAC